MREELRQSRAREATTTSSHESPLAGLADYPPPPPPPPRRTPQGRHTSKLLTNKPEPYLSAAAGGHNNGPDGPLSLTDIKDTPDYDPAWSRKSNKSGSGEGLEQGAELVRVRVALAEKAEMLEEAESQKQSALLRLEKMSSRQ